MASRDIANMHFFLEMKKKFPDLPEDIIRQNVYLCSEDQLKCLQLLNKESERHHSSSQSFTELSSVGQITESAYKADARNYHTLLSGSVVNKSIPCRQDSRSMFKAVPLHSEQVPVSCRSSFIQSKNVPFMDSQLKVLTRPKTSVAQSIPVIMSDKEPLTVMYKKNPSSSHTVALQFPVKNISEHCSSQMKYSTTKEHSVTSSCTPASSYATSFNNSSSKRHAVTLSITPNFPYRQQMQVPNNPINATASHSSSSGKCTTSVNLQLQPNSSNRLLEISTASGSCHNRQNFDSHVQISFSSSGSTFTARRLQTPYVLHSQSAEVSKSMGQCQSPQSSEPPNLLYLHRIPSQSQASQLNFYAKNTQHRAVSLHLKSEAQQSGALKSSEMPKAFVPEKLYPHQPYYLEIPLICQSAPKCFNQVEADHLGFNAESGSQHTQAYVQAVIHHQKVRIEMLRKEFVKEKEHCIQLRSEVTRIEEVLFSKDLLKNSFSYVEELKKLKEENHKLRVECNFLSMEVDMHGTGQVPLGVTGEDFYTNIFTGPNYSISADSTRVLQIKKSEKNIRSNIGDDDDCIKRKWRCTKCSFDNHPAMENCEMCELPKISSYIECRSNCPDADSRSVSDEHSSIQPKQAIGSIQISVTQNTPSISKGLKLQLTHRICR